MSKEFFNKLKLPLFIIFFFVVLILLWKLLKLPPEEELIEISRGYFERFGLLTVFIASIIEGTLLAGWYAPGGIVIFMGVILSPNPERAILSVLFTILGALIACTINYFVGKHGWYKVLLKLGVKSSLEKAEEKFKKHGFKTIYMSYWEPNLASLVSTAAGIAQAPFKKFLSTSIIAIVSWCAFWGTAAYIFGKEILQYLGSIFFGVMIIWIIYIIIAHKKELNKSIVKSDIL